MKAPYQIKRDEVTPSVLGRFIFRLVHVPTDRTVTTMRGHSPIAPEHLLKRQAELNTRAMLG